MTTLEFNALVRQYQGLVYTVCHQLVPDEGDAQDQIGRASCRERV